MTTKSELKEQCLRLSYEAWLNSWVGDPRISFEDYCEGRFNRDDVAIDWDNCSQLTEEGQLIIYTPDFIKEMVKKK